MKSVGVGSVLVGAWVVGIVLVVVSALAIAHHSVSATFDSEQPIELEGTVTKLEWFNPHIWIHLTVEEADGTNAEYQCEGSSPNALRRRGWSQEILQPGDRVSIEGLMARKDPYSCYTREVRLQDGTRLFSGNAEEVVE